VRLRPWRTELRGKPPGTSLLPQGARAFLPARICRTGMSGLLVRGVLGSMHSVPAARVCARRGPGMARFGEGSSHGRAGIGTPSAPGEAARATGEAMHVPVSALRDGRGYGAGRGTTHCPVAAARWSLRRRAASSRRVSPSRRARFSLVPCPEPLSLADSVGRPLQGGTRYILVGPRYDASGRSLAKADVALLQLDPSEAPGRSTFPPSRDGPTPDQVPTSALRTGRWTGRRCRRRACWSAPPAGRPT